MGAGELGRGDHALNGHGWIGKRDVVPDRAVEEHVFLQHHADLAAQPGRVDHAKIEPSTSTRPVSGT